MHLSKTCIGEAKEPPKVKAKAKKAAAAAAAKWAVRPQLVLVLLSWSTAESRP